MLMLVARCIASSGLLCVSRVSRSLQCNHPPPPFSMIDHAFRAIHYLQGDSGDTKPCPACGAPCLEGEVCSDECILIPELRKLAASLDRSDFSAETRTDVIMSFTEWCFGSIDELETLGEIIMHVDHFPDADFCVLQFLHECIAQATICTWGGVFRTHTENIIFQQPCL